ncbi:bacteriochlorophyll synthase [Novosphingobium sediminis]|uniref:Bacteriochlorophyll synthase n=1 Tax=Novosphingobium sediminis TaxID=707214 RepID=A0A512AH11_9SPHN|nr:BCD family MFS transporter [Novosphingobium sediminis]GEN98956.1 bacteriochlorophyll synthase [Novosphingobium sediminis]
MGFGWFSIIRLGLVQASIGAVVMLATSLLNRVMVVEYGMAAAVPAGLVALHYAVQLARPVWGHGSDRGHARTPWIIGGIAVLGLGGMLAVLALPLAPLPANALLLLGFIMIGAGVGAAGTSLLALLAAGVAPQRRAAAAAVTWIMMVMGIVISAGTAGALLEPFSWVQLVKVSGGIALAALVLTLLATFRLERGVQTAAAPEPASEASLGDALRAVFAETAARRFTVFVFLSMLAYSMQDLILEPFAGIVFGMTPAQSTSLSAVQHSGVLLGMIVAGLGGSAFAGRAAGELRGWIAAGCVGSALALAGLAVGAGIGPGWPLAANIGVLGFANGVFAVSAIGAMMSLAGEGNKADTGLRMGVWGAAQGIAFGLGGLSGAIGVDLARHAESDGRAFQSIFAVEAMLFMAAAVMAVRIKGRIAGQGAAVKFREAEA